VKATVSHPPPVVQPPAVVTLEMSEQEAKLLQELVSVYVSWTESAAGKMAQNLSNALEDAGFEPFEHHHSFHLDRAK
jgi:hypothetical protein